MLPSDLTPSLEAPLSKAILNLKVRFPTEAPSIQSTFRPEPREGGRTRRDLSPHVLDKRFLGYPSQYHIITMRPSVEEVTQSILCSEEVTYPSVSTEMEGFLYRLKRGKSWTSWSYRYYRVNPNLTTLEYFMRKPKLAETSPRGVIPLAMIQSVVPFDKLVRFQPTLLFHPFSTLIKLIPCRRFTYSI